MTIKKNYLSLTHCKPPFRHGSPFLYFCRSHFSQASPSQRATCHILSDRKESTLLFEAAVGLQHVEDTFSWQLQDKGGYRRNVLEKKGGCSRDRGEDKEKRE